jgi:hypothetical protein
LEFKKSDVVPADTSQLVKTESAPLSQPTVDSASTSTTAPVVPETVKPQSKQDTVKKFG